MHFPVPPTLSRLKSASGGTERDTAWGDFVAAHSAVVLHTCRAVSRDYDVAMDAYTFVLEALRENEHRRLRAYVPDGTTRFETWLLVVSRRLVLDYIRRRYGRSRSSDETRRAEHVARRRLEDLVSAEIAPDELPNASREAPDAVIQRAELTAALRSSIDELAPADRLLLTLRFVDERSVREIARTLQLPTVFHVYRRVSSVLETLRRKLLARGVEGAQA